MIQNLHAYVRRISQGLRLALPPHERVGHCSFGIIIPYTTGKDKRVDVWSYKDQQCLNVYVGNKVA